MESHPAFVIQPLDAASHRREDFDCGIPSLNAYLAKLANQDRKTHASHCWVLVEEEDRETILGYYTLSPEAIDSLKLPALPKSIVRKLPRYRRYGAALIGRLAVARGQQGQRLGSFLLMDALRRSMRAEIPVVVILVDPKDEAVAKWYGRFGFQHLTPGRMVVTVLELESRFSEWDSLH